MSGKLTFQTIAASNMEIDEMSKTIYPSNNEVSLGTAEKRFKDLWVQPNTIHLGAVDLKEEEGYFSASKMKIRGRAGYGEDIIFDPETGLQLRSAHDSQEITLNREGLTIGSGEEAVKVDSTIYDQVKVISDESAQQSIASASSLDRSGFVKDYFLGIDPNTNDVTAIFAGNFELGRNMNKTESMGLNTFMVKDLSEPLYNLKAGGVSEVFTEAEGQSARNKKMTGNNVNVTMALDSDLYIIPIDTHVNIRDCFPLNVLDLNRKAGQERFKAAFDTVGNIFYSADGLKFSGLNTLKGYVQVSSPECVSQYKDNTNVVLLKDYEYLTETITYYNMPLLFQNQYDGKELSRYEYYSSSDRNNRIDDKVYKAKTYVPVTENVFGTERSIANIQLDTYEKSFYPAIRLIRYTNVYTASFDTVKSSELTFAVKNLLGWESLSNAYTKYKTSNNNGEDWISKLIEITYAYLKYGYPLRPIGETDRGIVDGIVATIDGDADKSKYFNFVINETESYISLKKDIFAESFVEPLPYELIAGAAEGNGTFIIKTLEPVPGINQAPLMNGERTEEVIYEFDSPEDLYRTSAKTAGNYPCNGGDNSFTGIRLKLKGTLTATYDPSDLANIVDFSVGIFNGRNGGVYFRVEPHRWMSLKDAYGMALDANIAQINLDANGANGIVDNGDGTWTYDINMVYDQNQEIFNNDLQDTVQQYAGRNGNAPIIFGDSAEDGERFYAKVLLQNGVFDLNYMEIQVDYGSGGV